MRPLMRRLALLLPVSLLPVGTSLLHSEPAKAPLRFVDIAAEAGITARISHGGPAKDWIAEANGSGVAVLDYDNDGWMDILIVSGASMPELRRIVAGQTSPAAAQRIYLYRNLAGNKFDDVTEKSGLTCPYWGAGANAADYDNDGDVDILITTIGLDLLYRNDGEGTFTEVGEEAGLKQAPAWHTGSSFGDFDADGDLDLYVAGYLELETLPMPNKAPVCDYRGLGVFCGPLKLGAANDVLYRNNGNGTFTDITEGAGLLRARPAPGFTPVFEDFNQDGKLDIFVSNDSSPNFLYVNQGGGTFTEDALAAGLGYNADGKKQADMGVAVGDYDSDGDLDIFTTTFSEDYFPLFEQQAPGIYEDVSFQVGLRNETMPYLGWGCGFSDLDNDGDRDLWVANGHVYPTAGKLATTTYQQPISVLENRAGRFDASPQAVKAAPANSYRGAASADFDNDGKIDLLLLPIDGSPVLLRNDTQTQNSWLGLRLEARQGNRESIGARVEIVYCGKKQFDTVRNGGGYASRSDPRVHFGLGRCGQAARVTVRWPEGRESVFEDVEVNQWVKLRRRE